MLNSQILEKLKKLGRQINRATWLFAMCWFVVVALGAFLVLLSSDVYLRISNQWFQLSVSIMLGLVVAIGFLRFLFPLLFQNRSPVTTARKIESTNPAHRNELSSAVGLLSVAKDIQPANNSLNQTLFEQANQQLNQAELSKIIQLRKLWFSGFIALVMIGVISALFWARPNEYRWSGLRMLAPWENRPWPRFNDLELIDVPTAVFHGESVRISIRETRKRPLAELMVELDWANGRRDQSYFAAADLKVDGLYHVTIPDVDSAFYLRAKGGDAKTDFYQIEVIPRINLTSLDVSISSPEYSRQAIRHSRGTIQCLPGSIATLEASVDQKIAKAELVFHSGNEETRMTCEVNKEGDRFSLPDQSIWVLKQSGSYHFRFVDHEGRTFQPAESWQVLVNEDVVPAARISNSSQFAKMSTNARLSLQFEASDDVGIDSWKVVIREKEQTPAISQLMLAGHPARSSKVPVKQLRFEHRFALDQVAVKANRSYMIEFEVTDLGGLTTRAKPLELHVLDESALQDELETDLKRILKQTRHALSYLHDCAVRLAALETRLQGQSQSSRTEELTLIAATARLNDFAATIEHPSSNPSLLIRAFQNRLTTNQLESPPYLAQLIELGEAIEKAAMICDQNVSVRLKQVIPLLLSDRDLCLNTIQDQRLKIKAAISLIEERLVYFEKWYQNKSIRDQLIDIQQSQSELNSSTRSIYQSVLGKQLAELNIEQRKKLDDLAAMQQMLRQKLEGLASGFDSVKDDNGPSAQAQLGELIKMNIHGEMTSAAKDLSENRVGSALGLQRTILDALDRALFASSKSADLDNVALESNEQRPLVTTLFRVLTSKKSLDELVDRWFADANRTQDSFLGVYEAHEALSQSFNEIVQANQESATGLALEMLLGLLQENVGQLKLQDRSSAYLATRKQFVVELEELIASLLFNSPTQQSNDRSPSSDNANQNREQPGATGINTAELRVIVGIQQNLLEQSAALDRLKANQEITPAEFALRSRQLASRQTRLESLIRTLIENNKNSSSKNDRKEIPNLPDFAP